MALHPNHPLASRLLQIAVARLQNPLLATPTTDPPAVAGPAARRDDPHTSPLEIFLRRVVDHDLQPLNDSASRLLAIEDQDGFSSHRLTGILEQDPVLAAKMLRLANSAFQPSLARVRNLRDAVIRLGLETVRSAALGACLRETLGEGNVLDERIFWRHSAAIAVLTRLLAESRRDPGDEAFTAGLLHNIGLLALDQLAPQDLRRAIALAASAANPSASPSGKSSASPMPPSAPSSPTAGPSRPPSHWPRPPATTRAPAASCSRASPSS
ncbi:MAG: HD-like signal output (HDOD) domain, no enzymatic activity [Chloroflexi bacterium]|nr:MAG: HD-like signal output (HDOD) domain, no enzymatic activity [Chloroflexota bacterium]